MTDASSPASTSIGVGESRHAHRSDSSVALEQVVHQIAARVKDLKDNLDKNSGQWMIHELDRITQETLVLQEAEIHRSEISDVLDELGISVWNLSSNLKTAAQMNDSFNGINENLEVIAHLRQTGFIMVKVAAGPMPLLEEKMLLKVLNMAAKLAKAWFDNDNLLKADAALNDATNIEVTIKQLPRSRKSASDELRAISFINLHMYRAEVAAKQNNFHVASFVIKSIAESVCKYATMKEVDYLCHLCLKIGGQLNKNEMYDDAIGLLRVAQENVGVLDEKHGQLCKKLRIRIMRALAAAYLGAAKRDAANLQLAENISNMLMDENPASPSVYLLKLKIWKGSNGSIDTLHSLYYQAMDCCDITTKNLNSVFDIVHFVKEHTSSITTLAGIDILLKHNHPRAGVHIDRADFERIYVVKFHILANTEVEEGDEIKGEVAQQIQSSFTDVSLYHGILNQKTLAACQLIFWRAGDGQYHQRRYGLALKWYLCAEQLHPNKDVDKSNVAVLWRKIALCHIELSDFTKAKEALEHANIVGDNATTFFIAFHISLRRSEKDEAITSLERMCNATDFKIEMLSAAANLCHQRGDKDILVEVLRLLLNEYIDGKDIPDTEILIVLRVLVRLSQGPLKEPNTPSSQAIQTVCGYLDTTICILRKLSEKQSSPGQVFATARGTLFKELEWFAQTAWNIGLQSCENWKNGVLTNRFLGITFKLLDMIVPETIDIIHRKKLCLFISIASRMLENHDRDAEAMRIILEDIEKFKKLRSTTIEAMVEISPSNDAYQPTAANSAKMSAVSDPTNELMLLFEFEATVLLQQYETAVNAIKTADSFKQMPIPIFERMTDILLKEPNCPSAVTFLMLQLVLEAILSRERIDFIRYARWMRVLLTSALVRNKSAALPYYAQVIDCLSEMAKGQYPQEEIHYLMVMAWNEGIDYFQGNDLANSRVWCEVALSLLPYIHGYQSFEQEMQETFRTICTRNEPAVAD